MPTLLIALVVVLMIVIMGLLIWLLNNHMAARTELSGQATGLSVLQQQM